MANHSWEPIAATARHHESVARDRAKLERAAGAGMEAAGAGTKKHSATRATREIQKVLKAIPVVDSRLIERFSPDLCEGNIIFLLEKQSWGK